MKALFAAALLGFMTSTFAFADEPAAYQFPAGVALRASGMEYAQEVTLQLGRDGVPTAQSDRNCSYDFAGYADQCYRMAFPNVPAKLTIAREIDIRRVHPTQREALDVHEVLVDIEVLIPRMFESPAKHLRLVEQTWAGVTEKTYRLLVLDDEGKVKLSYPMTVITVGAE